MKHLFIGLLIFMGGFYSHLLLYGEKPEKSYHIVSINSEPEGTSVILTKDIDTVAYDYLSVDELNEILKK